VSALAGTAASGELRAARAHLRAQSAATQPLLAILLEAYPGALREEHFTFEAYLWAAELWYSYAFEVGGRGLRLGNNACGAGLAASSASAWARHPHVTPARCRCKPRPAAQVEFPQEEEEGGAAAAAPSKPVMVRACAVCLCACMC
jgi:hypothetical protein